MHTTRKVLVLGALLAGLAGGALAHTPMAHDCVAPQRPADDQNDRLWQAFLADIERFRACVTGKMEWHQNAAAQHNAAAREVVQAWNHFARTSLNAPEDFPWPPADE